MLVLVLREDTYVARPPDAAPQASVPAGAASATLDRLADALSRGDRTGAAALAAGGGAGDLGTLAGNARRLRLADVSFRYVDEVTALDDRGRWTAAVETTWRYRGFDRATARTEVDVRLATADEGADVRVLGFPAPDGTARRPLWLEGPVAVTRGSETLVVVARGVPAESYRRTARRALPEVRRVLPAWSGPLVVEVPGSGAGVAAAVGAERSAYDNVAAVTATVDGSESPRAPVHVFVNPDVFGELGGRGSQVVMTHEAVHVATGATSVGPRGDLPVWLREGFADYVALRDGGVPVERAAAQVIEQVRQDGPPRALPGTDDFDATGDQFGAAYEAAWLVCVVVADTAGEQALVGLYEDVSSGAGLDAALRDRAGLGVEELTARWRGRLSALAADGGA